LANDTLADGWVSYAVQPGAVKVGANEVSVTLAGDAGPVWTDLTVKAAYPKGLSGAALRGLRRPRNVFPGKTHIP
jgi:hypothetical protein